MLEISAEYAGVVDKVTAGHIFVDGRTLWDMDSSVFAERRRLARQGVVVIAATLSESTGDALIAPEIVSYGFVELDESQELLKKHQKRF